MPQLLQAELETGVCFPMLGEVKGVNPEAVCSFGPGKSLSLVSSDHGLETEQEWLTQRFALHLVMYGLDTAARPWKPTS